MSDIPVKFEGRVVGSAKLSEDSLGLVANMTITDPDLEEFLRLDPRHFVPHPYQQKLIDDIANKEETDGN